MISEDRRSFPIRNLKRAASRRPAPQTLPGGGWVVVSAVAAHPSMTLQALVVVSRILVPATGALPGPLKRLVPCRVLRQRLRMELPAACVAVHIFGQGGSRTECDEIEMEMSRHANQRVVCLPATRRAVENAAPDAFRLVLAAPKNEHATTLLFRNWQVHHLQCVRAGARLTSLPGVSEWNPGRLPDAANALRARRAAPSHSCRPLLLSAFPLHEPSLLPAPSWPPARRQVAP